MKKMKRIIVFLSVVLMMDMEEYQVAAQQAVEEGIAEGGGQISLKKQKDTAEAYSMESGREEKGSQEEFLEKYVYGEWRFAERLGTMDNGWVEYPGHPLLVDFTEQGAEEMENIRIYYGKDSVKIVDGLSPMTFSNVDDMNLFGREGFHEIRYPEYHISKQDKGIFHIYQGFDAESFFGVEGDIIFVRYALRHEFDSPKMVNSMAGERIYVNPAETDTIYLDFTGLWELERVEETIPEKRVKLLNRKDRGYMSKVEPGDDKFLEQYIYGEWNISKRLAKLEENGETCGWYKNISEQGVEEMKEGTRIWYSKDGVWLWQPDFSQTKDIYLFYAYGGNNDVDRPVYHIWGETGEVRLRNLYGKDEYVEMEGNPSLIEITYDLGYDITSESAVMGYCCASHVYVNPGNTDTLYLDFCGLWELERVDVEKY